MHFLKLSLPILCIVTIYFPIAQGVSKYSKEGLAKEIMALATELIDSGHPMKPAVAEKYNEVAGKWADFGRGDQKEIAALEDKIQILIEDLQKQVQEIQRQHPHQPKTPLAGATNLRSEVGRTRDSLKADSLPSRITASETPSQPPSRTSSHRSPASAGFRL